MPVEIEAIEVHTRGMPVEPVGLGVIVKPTDARTIFGWLLHRRYELIVPKWDDSPYGRQSAGLFGEALQSWRRYTRLKRLWAAWDYTLGSIAIALAAFAGFGSLGQLLGERTAAFITIGSGVAMGLATFLRSNEKRQRSEELAVAWERQMDDVALLYETKPSKDGSSIGGSQVSTDPEGWKTIIQALRDRAQSIRAGKTKLKARPAWPDSKSSRHA
jgi:hypothetical protein